MKKRLFSFIFILVLIGAMFTGCGNTKTTTEEETTVAEEEVAVLPMAEAADGFRVMIVGSGSPKYEVDRGQPSVLVQYKDKYFLVDCGNGSISTLVKNGVPPERIGNLLLTHQHYDHNSQFWDFFLGGSLTARPRATFTITGPEVKGLFDTTINYFKADIDGRIVGLGLTNDAAVYGSTINDITENTTFEIDGVKISTFFLSHGVANYAYKFEADGQTVVISGDFNDSTGLAEFAKGADIFVVDAMLTSTFDYIPIPEIAASLKETLLVSHEAADKVNAMVAETAAKKTVYTHLGGSSGIEESKTALESLGYKGELIAAEDGLIIEP